MILGRDLGKAPDEGSKTGLRLYKSRLQIPERSVADRIHKRMTEQAQQEGPRMVFLHFINDYQSEK